MYSSSSFAITFALCFSRFVSTKKVIDLTSFVRDTIFGWKILDYTEPFLVYYNDPDASFFSESKPKTTTVILRKGRLFFDNYGLPNNPVNLIMVGYMSDKRVSDMVPLDFDLEKTQEELEDL